MMTLLLVENVLGSRVDAELAPRLHDLQHRGLVDVLTVPASELARRRFRARSAGGKDVAITLPREQQLYDGAVLWLDDRGALLVQVDENRWLRLEPRTLADAIELGYHAGNLHWRVRFEGKALLVALEAPAEAYLARLGPLVADNRVAAAEVQPGTAP